MAYHSDCNDNLLRTDTFIQPDDGQYNHHASSSHRLDSDLSQNDIYAPSYYRKDPLWRRLLSFAIPLKKRPSWREHRDTFNRTSYIRTCPRLRGCLRLGIVIMVILGIIQLVTIIFGLGAALFPDHVGDLIEKYAQIRKEAESRASWPTDFTRDIHPIPCHSHNDYWRRVPFYSALSAGCVGVEADVWFFDDGELYVGHNTFSLTPHRTLASLYLNPILDLLKKQNPDTRFIKSSDGNLNGVYDVDPSQSLNLLIDFKTSGDITWPAVRNALEPLRSPVNYLTHFNGSHVVKGPVTIVVTGNAPFDVLTANKNYRDMFFDAPLDEMWMDRESLVDGYWPSWEDTAPGEVLVEGEGSAEEDIDDPSLLSSIRNFVGGSSSGNLKRTRGQDLGQGHTGTPSNPNVFDPSNSYYASADFRKAVGHLWRLRLSPRQMGLIRGQVRGAHARGLKVRYWGTPGWPVSLRDHVLEVLVKEGVDIVNVDDLKAAKSFGYKLRGLGWW
ncbi:MAG: Altered inheritance of mitochondria protein 6 [Cirrosporium novae-zelandiae]|nr:MAG: Altered inheritance of mitochondria protein 6 [Cirrosporium novae-zelandiae]